jgi:uncharacterized protein (TIGR03083 family)
MTENIWEGIAAERRALADVLEPLTEEQWRMPSALPGWRVSEVAAHLVWVLETPKARMASELARSWFSVARLTENAAFAERRPPAQVAQALRNVATVRFEPIPGLPPTTSMAEILVHGLDVRWPLGIAPAIPEDHAAAGLDFLVGPWAAFGFASRRGLPKGLSFAATDTTWRHGSGPMVMGTTDALLLSLCGRTVALDKLGGDGAEAFRARLRA